MPNRNMQTVLKECTALGGALGKARTKYLPGLSRYTSGYGEDGNKASGRKAKGPQMQSIERECACFLEKYRATVNENVSVSTEHV